MNLPNPFPGLKVSTHATFSVPVPQKSSFKAKRAGKNGTVIAMVLDESGSMNSCWDATIAGFNEFIAGQKAAKDAGKAYVTLVQFDSPHIKTVFANRPIDEVPVINKDTYKPNGGTNLLDAVGAAMENVNAFLASMKKEDRPGVIITIMTDGQENASYMYSSQMIKNMVAAAEKKDWTFTFLGANIDAFAVGSSFGMNDQNTVSYNTTSMANTMASVTASTIRTRVGKLSGLSTQDIYNQGMYTAAEIKSMKE